MVRSRPSGGCVADLRKFGIFLKQRTFIMLFVIDHRSHVQTSSRVAHAEANLLMSDAWSRYPRWPLVRYQDVKREKGMPVLVPSVAVSELHRSSALPISLTRADE
eukprot:2678778-Pleurochrysis_carterae.AAC.2